MLRSDLRRLKALRSRFTVLQDPARHRRILRLFRKLYAFHRSQHFVHQRKYTLFRRLIFNENLSGNAAALAHEPEEQMLCSDITIMQFLCRAVCVFQCFLRLLGKIICHTNSFLLHAALLSAQSTPATSFSDNSHGVYLFFPDRPALFPPQSNWKAVLRDTAHRYSIPVRSSLARP